MSDRDTEFRDFVTAQMEPLRGLAYLTCGDWQAAEDAVLTALAKLYVKWRRIDNPGAYARTAVVRAAIDETRRPWWRREHAQSDAMPDRPSLRDDTSVVDERLRIREALQKVPARLRAVLTLRYLEGLSIQETAEALGCPEGTVKSYTSRGLDALRTVLGVEVFIGKENHRAARAV
ncbi:SigE family RNA polymerase sigma factor [Actinoplanes sp. N902-109]|uniref:SigE family RNA polymerase sigma factor n=1 Tax=Actinoplanes sp. (strain N902-109) TaxID=649831 RepID=UPI0005A1819A|nr:SigE family RNA polymerase sigma factor [Actinoplanes sp. N902-109]